MKARLGGWALTPAQPPNSKTWANLGRQELGNLELTITVGDLFCGAKRERAANPHAALNERLEDRRCRKQNGRRQDSLLAAARC